MAILDFQWPIDFQWPNFLNVCLVAILDFSVSEWHGFGSVTQVCFGISVSNFMCMSHVAVGRSLTIFSYVAIKMAALWFWTMFNCNPPIAHFHPLLWGGAILVDHWSTVSSWFRWIANWEISTQIAPMWAHRYFTTPVHTLCYMYEESTRRTQTPTGIGAVHCVKHSYDYVSDKELYFICLQLKSSLGNDKWVFLIGILSFLSRIRNSDSMYAYIAWKLCDFVEVWVVFCWQAVMNGYKTFTAQRVSSQYSNVSV